VFNLKKNKLNKFFAQKGVSLSEALIAIVVSTIVFGATYAIYNNFQKTFVRQINYNNLKQEARFALHALQYDSRMAGFKHADTTNGDVQIPVRVLNDDGTEVTDDTEFGETVFFCFDTEDNGGNVQRKLIQYELQTPSPFSTSTEETILKKKIWNTTNCDVEDFDNTTVDVNWMPVAQLFDEFNIRLRARHIDFEIILETVGKKIRENYTASSYMRNLNFGGITYYVFDEEDLNEDRLAKMPFTGSLRVQCSNNITKDIQLANFQTEDDIIILHQGEKVGDTNLDSTYDKIRIESQKPPAITGIPSIGHSEMRLKLVSVTTQANLPPGLSVVSGYTDINGDGEANPGEWDGSLTLEGTLENTDTNYSFNSEGFQDFNITASANLETNCDGNGWVSQNQSYKQYRIRVEKYKAPDFSDVNLHTWEPKGLMAGYANYEKWGTRSKYGGPHYKLDADGRSFYLQQNISSPIFLVSKQEYDSFVLKGVVCSGGFPDCSPSMREYMDDDMLGFAAGYQRPSIVQKKWPDGKIRACTGVDYQGLKNTYSFSKSRLRNSLGWQERRQWNNMTEAQRNDFFGEPADNVFDMYLFSWWGMKATNTWNQSAIQVHQYKGLEFTHRNSCGKSDGPYLNHLNLGHQIGWYQMPTWYKNDRYTRGYNMLFQRLDNTRPTNTGTRNCSYARNSFSRISYNPGATHQWNCGYGTNTGVKNTVTLTYHPNKFRANIENKPFKTNANSQQLTAFDLRFDSSGVLKDYLNDDFPYPETSSPSNVPLPTSANALEELKAEKFKRFQKGAVAIATFSQPDNQYSNIQIAELPRYIPSKTANNKPMPKAQNLNYYLSPKYKTISKIYGLMSKSYDPAGENIEILVSSSSNNCIRVSNTGNVETGDFKSEMVDGTTREMNCRLSGTWRARTEKWVNKIDLPVINGMYDIRNKTSYKGARASVTTTEGGTILVFADGSFKYQTLPTGFNDGSPHEDSFYYAVQTFDTDNARISDIKKVYIGYNIGNTKPTGVSFKEEDETLITDLMDFDIAEDDKKNKIVGEIYTSSSQEPDTYDFVRFNLGDVPNDHEDKDVDHVDRFRIDQKNGKFYLVLNNDSDIRWSNLPANKKYFSIRIVATDLKGNQLQTTKKVYVDRVDCTETAMENITVYKTRAAMTIEGFIQGKEGEKVFRRQTVPLTRDLDEAVITFDYEERDVQPSVTVYEEVITIGDEEITVGLLANRCKDTHDFILREHLWSEG
jgi:type II secretory pathway component PulJ